MNAHHPRLPGHMLPPHHGDAEQAWPVARSVERYTAPYLSVRTDTIVDPRGDEHDRIIVQPHGAVAVLAIDEDDRILLIEQYRHAVGARLLELPAGILDVDGESARAAAARELAEEADLAAGSWEEMLALVASPGYSTERWRLFRATDLAAVPEPDRTVREAEEADIVQWWLPLGDAVQAVRDGRISNALAVAGIMTEAVRRAG